MGKQETSRGDVDKYRWKKERGLLVALVVISIAASAYYLFTLAAQDSNYFGSSLQREEDSFLPGTRKRDLSDNYARVLEQPLPYSSSPENALAHQDESLHPDLASQIQEGIRSNKPFAFFQALRDQIDQVPWHVRCNRTMSYRRMFSRDYKRGFQLPGRNTPPTNPLGDQSPQNRRIFYGSLLADEPWELLEIMGAETYGIFEAMVFVESNRTQSFAPRSLRNKDDTIARLQTIFGVQRIELRHYVKEDPQVVDLTREQLQREEILQVWKELGMQPDDIGYITDVDETFSRDFLRAIQTCPYVAPLDYDSLKCHLRGRIKGLARMYEGSPECVTKDREWRHPDMVIGACIEQIGNATEHPLARRYLWERNPGFATGHGTEAIGTPQYQENYAHVDGHHYPLWSAADFRMQTGGYRAQDAAFHLHNWFPDFDRIRHKYNTYGHAVENATTIPLEHIHSDLKLMAICLRNGTDDPMDRSGGNRGGKQIYHRVMGGLEASPKPWPIYFHDADYRQRKHQAIQRKLQQDEQKRVARLQQQQQAEDKE